MAQYSFDTLIIGAGQAGAQAAISLHSGKYEGSICIVGAEDYLPYERPPLSKDYLLGNKDEERLKLRPDAFWAKTEIEVITGQRIISVDPISKIATSHSGNSFSFDKLIWAAGGNARSLPIIENSITNAYTIRTISDVHLFRHNLNNISEVCIIGAGYIGLEAAAVLRKLGKNVTIIEATDRSLARVTAPPISDFFQQKHENHGVRFIFNSQLEAVFTSEKSIEFLQLNNGEKLPCDALIVGIGITPEISVLEAAGANIRNGISVDEYCRTSLSDIYAIGDCANHANNFADGAHIRLESVQNAIDQGKTAALHILGKAKAYTAIPWFWSDQYDLKLQTIGLSIGYEKAITRGDPSTENFSVIYLKDEKIIAADCINQPADFVQAKILIMSQKTVDIGSLTDTNISLKDSVFN